MVVKKLKQNLINSLIPDFSLWQEIFIFIAESSLLYIAKEIVSIWAGLVLLTEANISWTLVFNTLYYIYIYIYIHLQKGQSRLPTQAIMNFGKNNCKKYWYLSYNTYPKILYWSNSAYTEISIKIKRHWSISPMPPYTNYMINTYFKEKCK